MTNIYTLWIKGELSPLNHLCIASFKANGFSPIVYSFDDSITPDCEVRSAQELFSANEVYMYENMPDAFKFGGIAERLKAEMLYRLGGWHIDMDVVCLKPFDFEADYVLKPHRLGVVGNIIKAPKHSKMAEYYVKWTKSITKDNRDFERSFIGLTAAVSFLDLGGYVVAADIFGMDEDKFYIPLLQNAGMYPTPDRYAIHFCGAMEHYKNYEPNSWFENELKKYGII